MLAGEQGLCLGGDHLESLDPYFLMLLLKESFNGEPVYITGGCKLFLHLLQILLCRIHHRIIMQKKKTVQKVEPWIRRELEAILRDPDPSIIVHVAISLFDASLEGKYKIASAQVGSADDFLAPLRPFLQNWTEMFWHELRCFAESQFNVETYDAVVKYERLD